MAPLVLVDAYSASPHHTGDARGLPRPRALVSLTNKYGKAVYIAMGQ